MKHLIWIAIALVASVLSLGLSVAEVGDCPAAGAAWSEESVARCVGDLSKRIDQLPAESPQRIELLEKRAQLHEYLARVRTASGDKSAKAAYEAALADYSAALVIAPRNAALRRKRAHLLIAMGRGEDALNDAETLLAQDPASVGHQEVKGAALASLRRHKEAIAVYTHAIALAQSCAEASMLQRQINQYRHAFDPPLSKEQMREEARNVRNIPLYDVPEGAVTQVGFPCAPTPSNTFEDLVLWKHILFERRAENHRALNDPWAAVKDYEYAISISFTPEFSSVRLCELEIDLGLDYSAVEHCRQAFDSNAWSILSDPEMAAKIGTYLLEDGDLKGACRIALPYASLPPTAFEPNRAVQAYLNHPKIKTLQQRVKGGLRGAGLKQCGIEYRLPLRPDSGR